MQLDLFPSTARTAVPIAEQTPLNLTFAKHTPRHTRPNAGRLAQFPLAVALLAQVAEPAAVLAADALPGASQSAKRTALHDALYALTRLELILADRPA